MSSVVDNIINSEINETNKEIENKDNIFSSNLDSNENIGVFNVKVIGIGGAGCNAIDYITRTIKIPNNVNLWALNTDIKSLRRLQNRCNLFLLGKEKYRGAGSGSNPQIGEDATLTDIEKIKQIIHNSDMVFLIAGLGKGTGSGSTPIISKLIKELNIPVAAILNLPSIDAEGQTVFENAQISYKKIADNCDSCCTINNEKCLNANDDCQMSLLEAFEKCNEEIGNIIATIIDIINNPTKINIDFADIKNFFITSRTFMVCSFEIDNKNYSSDEIYKIINNSIKRSYCNIPIEQSNSLLINANICHSTPKSIISDIRNAFVKLSHNNKIWSCIGVDYHDSNDKIKIDVLVSSDKTINDINSSHFDYDNININNNLNSNDEEFDDSLNKLGTETNETNSNGLKTSSFIDDGNEEFSDDSKEDWN